MTAEAGRMDGGAPRDQLTLHKGSPLALAVAGASLYCLNLQLAYRGPQVIVTALSAVLVGACALALVDNRMRLLGPSLLFLCTIGFPEYGPDPYLAGFVAPFKYAKFGAAVCLVAMCRPAVTREGLSFLLVLVLSFVLAFIGGRVGDIWAEVWFAGLLLIALNLKAHPTVAQGFETVVLALERLFYLLPVVALVHRLTGVYDVRAGDTYIYFYGHWVGIASAIALYQVIAGTSTVLGGSMLRLPAALCTFYVLHTSYQSAHWVLFLVAAVLGFRAGFGVRAHRWTTIVMLIGVAAAGAAGAYAVIAGDGDTWVYLKVNQVARLLSGNPLEAGNSVIIRVAQLIAQFEQGTALTILIGRGLASTYAATGGLWGLVVFHEATYPEQQLASGVFQYVHETPVMILKWAGIVGVALVLAALLRTARRAGNDRGLRTLCVVVFFLYAAASLHTAVLVTGMYVLAASYREAVCVA